MRQVCRLLPKEGRDLDDIDSYTVNQLLDERPSDPGWAGKDATFDGYRWLSHECTASQPRCGAELRF